MIQQRYHQVDNAKRTLAQSQITQRNNSLNEHKKKNHGKDFHMINLLYFSIMQLSYSNLL